MPSGSPVAAEVALVPVPVPTEGPLRTPTHPTRLLRTPSHPTRLPLPTRIM